MTRQTAEEKGDYKFCFSGVGLEELMGGWASKPPGIPDEDLVSWAGVALSAQGK